MEIHPMKIEDGNRTYGGRRGHFSNPPSLFQGLFGYFDRVEQQEWFHLNWTTSLYFITGYVLFIHFGTEFMRNRKPFVLKRLISMWNLSLAIFSITACTVVVPEFFKVFKGPQPFYESVCSSLTDVSDEAMFWGWLFALSKIVELGDTVFLILRRRNLIFLHWYHHITVLLYVWYSYGDHISPARWFICVNYVIHAIMYSYYTLRSVGIRIPKWIAMTITSLQLSQMVTGVTVNVYAYRMKRQGVECDVSSHHLNLGFIMYASYFVLFAQFFYKAYLQNKDNFKNKQMAQRRLSENNNNNNNIYSRGKTIKVN